MHTTIKKPLLAVNEQAHRALFGAWLPFTHSMFSGVAENLAVAAVYLACGKLGLSLAVVNASASAVWPPTGFALAVLLIGGYRLWPGVFLGAFLVNITTTGSFLICLGIAGGNTCEGLLGAWLVCRFAGGLKVFERTSTFFRFVLLAAMGSTAVSSTVGVGSLCLGGFALWGQYGAIWMTWWLGDLVGDLMVTPLLVIWWSQGLPRLKPARVLEAAGLLVTVALVGLVVFGAKGLSGAGSYPLTYLALLPLLWAAFRFEARGAVTAALVMDAIAVWGTLRGLGPFANAGPNESFMFLQAFVGTAGLTAVALALAVSERKRAEQLLSAECALSRQLEEASTPDEALSHILEGLCTTLPGFRWNVAAYWGVDANALVLRCSQTWHRLGEGMEGFETVSRAAVLAPGISLPGQIWVSGEPAWIPDLQAVELNCPRAPYARTAGLHCGCAFPVRGRRGIVGVLELYSREIQALDPEKLRVFLAVGGQVGQFIERKTMEERLALVLRGSSDGIWDWDLMADRVYFSSRWKSMLGYTEGEVEHHFSAWERLLHPDDRERALACVQDYLAGRRPSFELEHRLRHKDGSYRWILSRGVALRDSAGRPIRMAGSHVDLTARKETEQRLRRAYAELSENDAALKAALQELRSANDELKSTQLQLIQAAKLESVGTLAAGVAHEVKNPLQTILLGVNYLTKSLPAGDDNAASALSDMRDAVTRANTIIRELLQLSAAADFTAVEADLNPVVERALRLINNEVLTSQVTVGSKLGAALPKVKLDCAKMEQVFINLFLNALQAMSPGGVLSVTTYHCRFGAALKLSGPAFAQFQLGDPVVVAEVRDTGPGIPEKHLAKLFDPFFTTKPAGLGTGLGLSVARKILELHGGAIHIRNASDKGAVVTVLLRAVPESNR